MIFELGYDNPSGQTFYLLKDLEEYTDELEFTIKFTQVKNEYVSGVTNISTNPRLFEFVIITQGLFKQNGWFDYELYDGSNNLVQKNECHILKESKEKTIYNGGDNKKTIYNG